MRSRKLGILFLLSGLRGAVADCLAIPNLPALRERTCKTRWAATTQLRSLSLAIRRERFAAEAQRIRAELQSRNLPGAAQTT